jgi:ParB family chromosome partitioning protein
MTLVDQAHALSSSIPISQIYIGKRRRRDYGDMEGLKKDLTENGQITAITVCPPTEEDRQDPDYTQQPWSLVAGGRRLRAAVELGWTTIRAIDREALPELQRRVLELAENIQRKDMSMVEVVQAKQEIYLIRKEQNPEITQAEVAKEVGETAANFSRDLRVAEILEQRPELKNSSSKKAVIRQAKFAEHFEARSVRDEVLGQSHMINLGSRMVTADARDWIRTLPGESVDLVFTDLPYGIDHFKQGHKVSDDSGAGSSEYDDGEAVSLDLFTDLVPQMIRVARKTGWVITYMAEANYEYLAGLFSQCCITHAEYYGVHEGDDTCAYRKVEEPRWYWYRPNSQNRPRFPEQNAQNVIEPILVFNKGEGKLYRPCTNLLMYDAEYGMRIHSMQKAFDCCKDIISRVTLPGDVVIDPCFGSGVLLAAGAALARDIRGCEMNPALRGPALGLVSPHFQGVAPRSTGADTSAFLEQRLSEMDDTELELVEE